MKLLGSVEEMIAVKMILLALKKKIDIGEAMAELKYCTWAANFRN